MNRTKLLGPLAWIALLAAGQFFAKPALAMRLELPTAPPRVWSCSEFVLDGLPAAANPYDPDSIAVDATFTAPSGRSISLPAFWYQPYTRRLDQREVTNAKTGKVETQSFEALSKSGDPGWRLRWTPLESGKYQCVITATQAGVLTDTLTASLTAEPAFPGSRGFAHVEPIGKRYFKTDDGQPLPLLGACLCYPNGRGTYDYDDWLSRFAGAGMNYTRLWLWHGAFGIEFFPNERLNYNQEHAWQLDYVLDEAQSQGIYVMLCLDYHGIFQVEPDAWGGNNFWPRHAYNQANGGPCATQNDFFANEAAKVLYRKRLRYLLARYGSNPAVISWELFNEIDNDRKLLNWDDVLGWHQEMATWIKIHDPYGTSVTTSLGSDSEDKPLWKLPALDFTMWHWYSNWGGAYTQPALMATDVAFRFQRNYAKPMTIGEFGTNGLNGDFAEDPLHRGLQQALWAGVMGGSAGTAMPWYWTSIDRDHLYPLWTSIHNFLHGTGFGSADWHPGVITAPVDDGRTLSPRPGVAPFDETIALARNWSAQPATPAVIRQPGDGVAACFTGYISGSSKPALVSPLRLRFLAGPGAKLVMHLNSVSFDAILAVRSNGREIFRRALPNLDGKSKINNEYNEDIPVPLPAGAQDLEITNPGGDWAFLDWIKIEGALPAAAPRGAPVPLDAWSMTDGKSALVWVVDPHFCYPRGALIPAESVSGGTVTLTGLPSGRYQVTWWNTKQGTVAGHTVAKARHDSLPLAVPPFEVDIAAKVELDKGKLQKF